MKFERDTSCPQSPGTPLLFLPGWGFDSRLIQLFDLLPGENLILPCSFPDPRTFVAGLHHFLLEQQCEKIRIIGWSMGANLALEFAQVHSEYVESIDLFAMRPSWPHGEIEEISHGVVADLSGYMVGFYRKCFLGYKKQYREFVNVLQDDYLAKLNQDVLFAGLRYLENFPFPESVPTGVKITLVHGRKDVVAPLAEMVRLPGASEDVVRTAGHMVLLDKLT